MTIVQAANFYRHQVQRIKENLEMLKNSNFCFKEKADLRKIYRDQLEQNERKLKSFSYNQQN